ncbi:MAG: hypothetical protein JO247_22765 [Chloroflexi bacterium]|nr:hypothetical protein [Chloroflexota bacterium]
MKPLLQALAAAVFLAGCGGTAPNVAPSSASPSITIAASPQSRSAAPKVPLISSAGAGPQTSTSALADTAPAFSHVFVVIDENTDLEAVLGSGAAPTFVALAKEGAVAANYYAISHPSEPNYIALVGGDVFGVNSDSLTTRIDAPTIVDQLEKGGRSWKAYMEGLPAPGSLIGQAGNYAKKHDPFVLFTSVTGDPHRLSHVVPLTQLNQDLATNQVPDYSFIVPDLCHDMHDCGVDQGDPFLATLSSAIQGSKAWDGKAVLFVTFDEAEGATASATCCGSLPGGGKVGLIAVSPLAKAGYTSQQPYNHYSLLRTVEDAWHLGTLAHSGDPGVQPLADLFK